MRTTIALALFAVACGGPESPLDASMADGGGDAGSVRQCERAADCETSEPCSTAVCEPGNAAADARGCIVRSACGESEVCEVDRCVPYCEVPDADGDGSAATACGGDDCDDTDPNAYPGNVEVCDPSHDEDCDPTTIAGTGDGDMDGDGAVSNTCCNSDSCGGDCDDSLREFFPGARELCNAIDDDCDGEADETGAFCPVGVCVDRRCRAIGWERVYHANSVDHVYGISVDADGNTYALLYLDGAADMDGDGTNDVDGGYHVVSLSPEGRHRWHVGVEVSGARLVAGDERSSVVVADSSSLRWLSRTDGTTSRTVPMAAPAGWSGWRFSGAGWSGDSLYVGGTLYRGDPATSMLEEAILIFRFDAGGTEVDRRLIETPGGRVQLTALGVNAGALAISGWAREPVSLVAGVDAHDFFAARLDAGLDAVWAVSDFPAGVNTDVAISSSGDVAVVGQSSGSYAPFWGGSTWPGSYGDNRAYIIMLAPDGTFRWHRVHVGASNAFAAAGFDERDGLMVSGTFSGEIDVTPRGRLRATGTSDAFFGVFDVADGFVLAARSFSGSTWETVEGAAVDRFGNLVLSGGFGADIRLPSGTLYTDPYRFGDIWIARIADLP